MLAALYVVLGVPGSEKGMMLSRVAWRGHLAQRLCAARPSVYASLGARHVTLQHHFTRLYSHNADRL